MRIHVSSSLATQKTRLDYLFRVLAVNKKTKFEVVLSDDSSAPIVGRDAHHTFRVTTSFANDRLSVSQLNSNGLFESENGAPDYISSAFFFLTSLQEYQDNNPDPLGRFQYKNSYQARFNSPTDNLVQHCFDQIAKAIGVSSHTEKTSFFLSHDIDLVYGSIKEDGFYALKKGRIDKFLQLLFHVAVGRPDWLNMDQIMKIESEYDCRSTFFWIMNQGGTKRLMDADYNFQSSSIQQNFSNTGSNGFENGIHKSLSSKSFREEIERYGMQPLANRYHYLKFSLPAGYDAVEEAGLKLDASLGFSEQMGFRNSYGLPVNPFNFQNNRPYSFVEVPLHVMDRTFFVKKMDLESIEKNIFDFFEKNRSNCVLSVLWHNNFFTDYKYKGYLSLYKKILQYIKDNNFKTISQQEILNKYSISWP
ncbi:MAG TPA: hypothetical protein VGD40_19980 [Chryseosolibacter sp.]